MQTLIDQHQRKITYLRLSVTDRCDLRCFYCMPDNAKIDYDIPDDWLTFDEIIKVIKAFTNLGVSSIRLTGGEPLLRKGLPQLASQLITLPGLKDLSLSSNATRLAKYADELYQSGISRINISLDTINPKKFTEITKGKVNKIIEGLLAAKKAGINPIKINMVLMKGINDGDDVEEMVEFCIKHGFTLRFIETMPMGDSGRNAQKYFIDLKEIEDRLATKYELIPSVMHGSGPARYVKIVGKEINIGFITPISQHFCDTCNRVRLSAMGDLYMCLGDDYKYPLRHLLRDGISDADLEKVIQDAINLKPYKHDFNDNPSKVVRFMSKTGG